jgi:hypothetical protein
MSVLAKLFIVIQALLVMVYLGVASTLYQHRRDWRNSYQKLKERYHATTARSGKVIKVYDDNVKVKDEDIIQKDREIIEIKNELDGILSNYQSASQKLSRKNIEFDQLQESNNKLTNQTEGLEKEIRSLTTRQDELNGNLTKAKRRRSIAERQVARLVSQKFNLEADLGELRKDYAGSRRDLRDKELLVALAAQRGINFATLLDGPPTPLVRGAVREVKSDVEPALVLIDVGADDEVEKGFRFSVYRNDKFVGKLVVESIEGDAAACRVHWVVEGESVKPGDSVSTRLP